MTPQQEAAYREAAAVIRRDYPPNVIALVARCAQRAEECDAAIEAQDTDRINRVSRLYNCCRDQLRWLGVDESLVEDAVIGW